MKRIYHPYHKWECFHSGLYEERKDEKQEERIYQSMMLLQNPLKLHECMDNVREEWKHSCELYFSHTGYNRRAWLGQAACNHHHGATEFETRQAWRMLTPEQMEKANYVAEQVIKRWEELHYEKIYGTECFRSYQATFELDF